MERLVTTMTMKLVTGLLVLSAFTKADTKLPNTEELIDSNEIFDVIENVIAKEDPMLQVIRNHGLPSENIVLFFSFSSEYAFSIQTATSLIFHRSVI